LREWKEGLYFSRISHGIGDLFTLSLLIELGKFVRVL
jgi:hypothetical protein